jgi:organic radical activating enzyme
MYAGKDKDDMWNQMQEHIPYLEQIYFAGGEPLIMEEHYNVLKELVRLKRFDVRLQYNTNFSRLTLKDENVLDYWRLFESVSVGASLDAMGPRAEYIRKGTKWDQIVRNREQMIKRCPDVDFYVSSTVSIYNVMHVMDFHRDWVEQGLIKAADWNINILQGPDRDRIDVLPLCYKEQVKEKILAHIEWLKPQDHLQRATNGYQGIINFMQTNDCSHLLKEFFRVNDVHDYYREETFEQIFFEYSDLRLKCLPGEFTDQELIHFKQACNFKISAKIKKTQDIEYDDFIKHLRDTNGQKYAHTIHMHIKNWFEI